MESREMTLSNYHEIPPQLALLSVEAMDSIAAKVKEFCLVLCGSYFVSRPTNQWEITGLFSSTRKYF